VSERRSWCQKGVQNGAVVRKGFVVRKELLPDRRSSQRRGCCIVVDCRSFCQKCRKEFVGESERTCCQKGSVPERSCCQPGGVVVEEYNLLSLQLSVMLLSEVRRQKNAERS
jgi:hypothetical protein